MLVSEGSPLRRIPFSIDRKRAAFYDSIRFSLEMYDYSYCRLFNSLYRISLAEVDPLKDFPPLVCFQDAWSVVDSLNRTRVLLRHLPGHKAASLPEREIFLRNTNSVENLRNAIQHLDKEILDLIAARQPIWGTLTWYASYDDTRVNGCSCILVAGSIFSREEYRLENPCGKVVTYPVGLISLTAAGQQLNISDTAEDARKLIEGLNRELLQEFGNLPSRGTDLFVKADMRLGD